MNKKHEDDELVIDSTGPEAVVESPFVEPLKLNADFGREDLNNVFKKLEDKINEIIRKK